VQLTDILPPSLYVGIRGLQNFAQTVSICRAVWVSRIGFLPTHPTKKISLACFSAAQACRTPSVISPPVAGPPQPHTSRPPERVIPTPKEERPTGHHSASPLDRRGGRPHRGAAPPDRRRRRLNRRLRWGEEGAVTGGEKEVSYGPPWAHYLGGYQDRLLGGPLGLPGLCYTAPEGVEHKDYTGVVLG
jgi:hypothetical protein